MTEILREPLSDFMYLTHNQHHEPRWAWGMRCEPELEDQGALCPRCRRGRLYDGNWYPSRPLRMLVEEGKGHPDFIGNADFLLAVSDKVWRDMQAGGVTGVQAFPLAPFRAKGGDDEFGPYWHLEPLGRCKLDTQAMGIHVKRHCELCYKTEIRELTYNGYHLEPGSWDGSDIYMSELFPRVRFCSRKVWELAGEHQWTCFRFEVAEDPTHLSAPPPRVIKYKVRSRKRPG
jgi:hypothetical protein